MTRQLFVLGLLMVSVLASPVHSNDSIVSVDFDDLEAGESITAVPYWSGFNGFRGNGIPTARVLAKAGVDQSNALAISHSEPFRTDNFGLRRSLPKPISEGVAWVQCSFKPPKTWHGGLVFDLRGEKANQIIARVAGGPFKAKDSDIQQLRWHSVFNRAYWRLYTKTKIDQDWHTVTVRIDFEQATYACWLDDQTLGEDLPLTGDAPFAQIYIGVAGAADAPAMIDNLVVSRTAPRGFSDPKLLPVPEKDLLFRFAATGDPQLGFTSVETDKARFAHATDQINRSGAKLTLMLGDMVHFNKDVSAYESMRELVKRFKGQYHYVRGNHEIPELFTRYFHRELHYSVVHKGVRFVIIDAEGNHVGMSDEQLSWIESEFKLAEKGGEEIVVALHVSPWQNNERGKGKYNQIGEGRERLRLMMRQYKVLLSLSGHYHRALWHAKEEETHYLVLGGTALVKGGPTAWCSFDVYPDRIVVHQKPLFFAYETKDVKRVHSANGWLSYKEMKAQHPYAQQGPLTIKRHRAAAK